MDGVRHSGWVDVALYEAGLGGWGSFHPRPVSVCAAGPAVGPTAAPRTSPGHIESALAERVPGTRTNLQQP